MKTLWVVKRTENHGDRTIGLRTTWAEADAEAQRLNSEYQSNQYYAEHFDPQRCIR